MGEQKPVRRYRARATSKARVRKIVREAVAEGKPWPRDRIDERMWPYATTVAGGK